ncbi:MAG: hypothetical protein IIY33_03750, partial [Erysipelotrichaceae bacterium]|nr:hypothetical protein [Erysipelotrichaceae bacterium]
MSVSKKLKQLMKVLLVVFMSFTVIVPDGLVKAESTLTTDKAVYNVGDPIMVTVNVDGTYPAESVWVSLLKTDDQD